MQKATLRTAFEWTCEECGIDQFVSCIAWEGSIEDKVQAAREMGVIDVYQDENDFPEGELMAAPVEVECKDCHAKFETEFDSNVVEDQGE